MPLGPDDIVCHCFHVPLRKIVSFCRVERPRYASQISHCLSAGTGCGWCVPILKRIHRDLCGQYTPWWRKIEDAESAGPQPNSPEQWSAADYAEARRQYLLAKPQNPPDEEVAAD